MVATMNYDLLSPLDCHYRHSVRISKQLDADWPLWVPPLAISNNWPLRVFQRFALADHRPAKISSRP